MCFRTMIRNDVWTIVTGIVIDIDAATKCFSNNGFREYFAGSSGRYDLSIAQEVKLIRELYGFVQIMHNGQHTDIAFADFFSETENMLLLCNVQAGRWFI